MKFSDPGNNFMTDKFSNFWPADSRVNLIPGVARRFASTTVWALRQDGMIAFPVRIMKPE